MGDVSVPSEHELLEVATKRVTERRDFRVHLAIYLVVNAMLWVLWAAVTGTGGYPWPIWVTLGWGIGVAVQWLSIRRRPISAAAVAEEMEHLRQQ